MSHVGRYVLGFGALLSLWAAGGQAGQKITQAELRAHVEFLASPELTGRDAPGRGSEIAQRYIATRFEEYGLQAFPENNGYYQTIPLLISKPDYEQSSLFISRAGDETEFRCNQDVFYFPRGGEDVDIIASVLLAGYGICAPEFKWDDFQGIDPAGKFLLIFNREPQENDSSSLFNGAKPTKYSQPAVKVRIAREAGAKGLLIIQPPNNGLPPIEEALKRFQAGMYDEIVQLDEDRSAFPVFYLKAETARSLLGADFDLANYQSELDRGDKPNPIQWSDVSVRMHIRFKDVQQAKTANIVGYFPGKSEVAVLLMAHHDHLGTKGDSIYFGADDNASGTAGLLSIARALSSRQQPLARGVIFLSTGVEEDGTLGSLYFSRHLPMPSDKIVAAINMDEIGRDASSQFKAMQDSSIPAEENMLMIFYSGQTPPLAEVAQRENKTTKLNLILEPVLHFSGSSDHIHFHDLGIPSIFVFSGFHSDYHTPHDTVDKIDFEKMTRICELVLGITENLAQSRQRPYFDATITKVESSGRKYGY